MTSDRRRPRIQRFLDEAEQKVARYDWQVVREAAQAVLAFDTDNSDALDLLTGAQRAISGSFPQPTGQPATSMPDTTPTSITDHPTSFAISRYQVKRSLGEGGKRKVYLTHDSILDRDAEVMALIDGMVAQG